METLVHNKEGHRNRGVTGHLMLAVLVVVLPAVARLEEQLPTHTHKVSAWGQGWIQSGYSGSNAPHFLTT